MITEDIQKKIYFWVIVGAAILGAIFLIWAVFFNRGTLTINATPPFTISIEGLITESCTESPCSIVVAPGEYEVLIQKDGYRDIKQNMSIPIGGEEIKEITFSYIPVISEVGKEKELNYFANATFEMEGLEEIPIFGEENYVSYLKNDPETKRQTLYVVGIAGEELDNETVATSFIRTINDYKIIPTIQEKNSIFLIDYTDEKSTLYLIDLGEKSRNSILSYPLINDVEWIPNTEKFIFEARDEGETATSIFVYNTEDEKVTKLAIKTTLQNVVALTKDTLIIATNQNVFGGSNEDGLDGQIVTLGELAASPSVATSLDLQSKTSYLEYSLETNEAKLLLTESSIAPPEVIQMGADRKSIFFLAEGIIYELQFKEE